MRLSIFLLAAALADAGEITLEGRVVDARTGEPIAKVRIAVPAQQAQTQTDDMGKFRLYALAPGEIDLTATTVGYGLVKKRITIKAGENALLEIALHQEAAVRTDTVTVTRGPFDIETEGAASEKTLSKSEIQALAMVLVGDPLRAAQALPGVATSNDFRAEFSVRGAGYKHVGVFVDGVLTDNFVHAGDLGVNGTASTEKLSLSVINADTVSDMSLLSGAFPSKFGDSTAAVLSMETRDGNRIKPAGRIVTGLLGTSAVVDGPFAKGKGSWLFAGRSSIADYLDRFIEHVTGTSDGGGASVDYSDAQTKLVYDVSSHHQFGVSAIWGLFNVDQRLASVPFDPEKLDKLRSENVMATAFWKYTPGGSFYSQTRVFGLLSEVTNRNASPSVVDSVLDDQTRTQTGVRNDTSYQNGAQRFEAGLYIRRSLDDRLANGYFPAQPLLASRLENFSKSSVEQAYYFQDTARFERLHVSLTAGGRLEHSDLTGETIGSPRVGLTFAPAKSWTIRAGAGLYSQFPDFQQVFGYFGNRDLRAERAAQYNVAVERLLGSRTRILVEVYDREERNTIFGLLEPRLTTTGAITGATLPYRNVLHGHARGSEISLQRRSANGFTGWVSYAYSSASYQDNADHLSFPSDFDQRHTVNAFGSYRIRPSFNVSAQWRYGSGFPWPGFLESVTGGLQLGTRRNQIRLPDYSRLDLRATKSFVFQRSKLTASGELLNVLNRDNFFISSTDPLQVQLSGRYGSGLQKSFGFLAALSLAFEF